MNKSEKVKRNSPMKVCLALRSGLPVNVKPGERICLAPSIADSYARQDLVVLLTDVIRPQDIRDAGGMDSYLEANPKLRILAKQKEKMIKSQLAQRVPAPSAPVREPEY